MQTYTYTDTDFYSFVSWLKSYYTRLWNTSSCSFPALSHQYTPEQQRGKEKELDRIITGASVSMKDERQTSDETRFQHMKNMMRNTLIDSVGLFHCRFDDTTREGFSQSTDDFILRAKKFNPSLSGEEIYQALRNVWIMNSIQSYLGHKIVLTPSSFAYSMLYPYTDNILDAPDVEAEAKHTLNQRISFRLAGGEMHPANTYERDIFTLFEIIEEEFDRSRYPHVFESLLAIHHAQIRSVFQQSHDRELLSHELLDISIEKGGSSVLADGYLIDGNLAAEDGGFIFGYGVLLQLIDDLQDIDGDLANHQTTLFHDTARRETLDEITNRLLSFIHGILLLARRPRFHESGGLGELIERSCLVMVLESIARNRTLYSAQYVRTMEKYSPVGFEYFRQMKDHLRKLGKKMPGRLAAPSFIRLGETDDSRSRRGKRRDCPDFIKT
jgi:hypothetical protein